MKNLDHFKFKEFVQSSTANKLKIDNTPDFIEVGNIFTLACCLDIFRERWSHPLQITSGYRCKTLNKAVGGVANSYHLIGRAADMVSPGVENYKLFNALVVFAKSFIEDFPASVKHKIECDNNERYEDSVFEIIHEGSWIHFAYKL